ncbi:hypothetical protein [Frigoriglobus tundricola]|uniref:DUF3352 domain-containing protein n=1 Tax=Frigoriglobus tundricola TaxID=2774151 RepID=A0A6M5Z191_9BACT|nr:hypothetical protein [Frigoriglobus tundricola]QJW98972.1 hypothetical protein FTUN_6567 [Frigoriglobus tundricola]
MSLFVRTALAAVTVAVLATSAPTLGAAAPVPGEAGKAVTFPFPAKAPVVVQVNGLGTARDRLTAMLKAALPDDYAAIKKNLDDGLKQALADRKVTAIPTTGRIFLVVNDISGLTGDNPTVSLLLPVTGYKEFRGTFLTTDEQKTFEAGKTGVDEVKINLFGGEQPAFLVDLKEYVAITPDRGTAETYANKYTRASTTTMPVELAKTFVAADASVYVNLDVINDTYGDQIRAFKGFIDFGVNQGLMGGMVPGVSKKQIEAIKTVLHGVFQAVEDGRGVVVAAEFRPEGMNLRLQGQFAEDTASWKLLRAEEPGSLADLAKLPVGLNQYGASKYGKKVAETIRGLNPEFGPADDDEKGAELIDKRMKELLAAGPQGEVTATGAPDVTLSVAAYTDAKKAVAALVGCYEAISAGGRIQSVVLKDAPKVTPAARKHKGFTFTEIRLAFDFEATVKDLPDGLKENTREQLKRMLAEKTTLWIGTDGKAVVLLTAKDWGTAAGTLDQFLDGRKPIGNTAGYKLTRQNLPPETSALLLTETGQTLTALLDAVRAMEGTVPDLPKIGKIKPLKGDPTFLGVAVTLKGDTATANVFVPGTAIAAGRSLLADVFKKVE